MAPKRFKLFTSGLMAAALLGPIGFLLSTSPTPETGPDNRVHTSGDSTAKPVKPASVPEISSIQTTTRLPPLPPELEGLEPQTNFKTDENGNLIPDHELRVLFDFFLANIDREPLTTVLQRILVALDSQLAEPAKGQALSLLERYVGYGISIEQLQDGKPDGITTNGFDLDVLKQRQREFDALRQSHFAPEEIDAFFGEDTQLDSYTLARIGLQQNESLTDAQRQRQLQQLDHQLPEPVRLARKRAVIHADVYQQAQHLKTSGASESDLYNLRATELGDEAATHLARLDREQSQWQDRLTRYRQERSRILEAGLSETDRITAIDNLRDNLFSGPERLRVRALDADQ